MFFLLAGSLFIVMGMLNAFAQEYVWHVEWWQLWMAGIVPERTAEWGELKRVKGLMQIGLGVMLLMFSLAHLGLTFCR